MDSPITYYGGKGNMWANIIEQFPPDETYKTYIEPFGGSFSVGLKTNISPIEIYNDLEQNVYSLYKVLSDDILFNEFKKKCDLAYYNQDMYVEFKNLLNTELNTLDRAFYFFYVNRSSYNGTGNFRTNTSIRRNMSKSVSDYLSCIDRLPELHQRLSKVLVLNTDGTTLIKKHDNIDTFLYCDPPYEHSTRTDVRYKVDMNREQHIDFLNTVMKVKSKILISGYDCELYNILVDNGFTKIDFNVNTVSGDSTPRVKIETLWKNY
jgi:DNA adenine methylase